MGKDHVRFESMFDPSHFARQDGTSAILDEVRCLLENSRVRGAQKPSGQEILSCQMRFNQMKEVEEIKRVFSTRQDLRSRNLGL